MWNFKKIPYILFYKFTSIIINMRIIIIVALTCLVVFGAQKDDLVSKTDLKKFNIDITESLYSGYLSANEDGSA
jgi:hypothetical protein